MLSRLSSSVYAAGDDAVKIGLVGMGGRGTGAANLALSTEGKVKLVAVADAVWDVIDDQLKQIYTTIDDKDVMKKKGPISGVFGSSMTDNSPLKALVAKYVTQDLLDKIAVEHGKGRRLLVGTTSALGTMSWFLATALANASYVAAVAQVRVA